MGKLKFYPWNKGGKVDRIFSELNWDNSSMILRQIGSWQPLFPKYWSQSSGKKVMTWALELDHQKKKIQY